MRDELTCQPCAEGAHDDCICDIWTWNTDRATYCHCWAREHDMAGVR